MTARKPKLGGVDVQRPRPLIPPHDPLVGDQLSPRNSRRPSAWPSIRFQQGERTLVESWLPPPLPPPR
jgi:hypothetical protein